MMDFSQLAVSIDMQRNGSVVMIRPHIENPTPLSLHYRMAIKQSSSSGHSGINQDGEVQSGAPGNSVTLSMPEGATCQVHLEVFQNDTLLKSVEGSCSDASVD
ncbi:curli-like amyloid fiber formation chaperone CsgH [Pseudomonas huanghezhanensis]|uniref:curli-like amyloid fiber formation chaperone CsgH n=1 Tax=Pseudomonas huanghezhanensis TaxID=3002903 RepID=UPI0022869886|nr:curli-like amyloid fiber formation chaperone CsgH [Pseudomonas sp. BSw22131]